MAGKRDQISLDLKLKIIDACNKSTKTKTDIAKEFGLKNISTLCTIIKNKDAIIAQQEKYQKVGESSRKRMRSAVYSDVEEALFKWFENARTHNLPISGPILSAKGEDLAKKLGHNDFKLSHGWLERFKVRFGIVAKSVCGESSAVDDEVVNKWKIGSLSNLLKEFAIQDIFNADETGLFYRLLPDKTLTLKNKACHGGKRSKERITVMICANMDGTEKEKLLVIGKFANPRCFKGVSSLPVDYEFNRKSWMTSSIFEKWINKFDSKMRQQKRKVLLLIDNCAAHPHALIGKLKAVTLKYFPPGTTSKLQPMDQGIIQALKSGYRHRLIKKILCAMEKKKEIPQITIKDAIDIIHSSWCDMKSATISNCFKHAGFNKNNCNDQDTLNEEANFDNEDEEPLALLRTKLQIPGDLTFNDYIHSDDNLLIAEELTDDDIIESLKSKQTSFDQEDIDDDPELEIKPITNNEANKAIEIIRRYFETQSNVTEASFSAVCHIEDFISNSSLQSLHQAKVTDYFNLEEQ